MQQRGLNSLTIKIIACTAMLIDHIGFLFFPDAAVLREIGRLALPLFAFLLAEGTIKTRNSKNYIMRLAIFAVISQLPYSFMLYAAGASPLEPNIFFLLTLGAIMLAAFRYIHPHPLKILLVVLTALIAELTTISYGAYGIIVIAACFLLLQKRVWASTTLFVTATVLTSTVIPKFGWAQLFSIFSLPIMATYNGRLGPPTPRWLFYWFYPAHMVLLSGIALLTQH